VQWLKKVNIIYKKRYHRTVSFYALEITRITAVFSDLTWWMAHCQVKGACYLLWLTARYMYLYISMDERPLDRMVAYEITKARINQQ
jgi:hypothetical protein